MAEESDAPAGPLDGLHIVDLCTYVAGPSGMMTLAQLGADVVRVDPLGGASDFRRLPRDQHGTSLYWVGLNKAKQSLTADLRNPAARDIVTALIAAPGPGNGIVVTNSVGQDWLSYESLRQVRPDLIHVQIDGRSDGRAAVDYTINCEVGLPWLTGSPESGRPVNHVLPAWDLMTGLYAALAVLTAERARRETGLGRSIRVSLADVAVATMGNLGYIADAVVNKATRLRDGNFLYGSFGCDFGTSDGRRVMVVALTTRHWTRLVELTGRGEALAALEGALEIDLAHEAMRFTHRSVVQAFLAPWFESRTRAEIVGALDGAGVLWGDYRTVEEMVHDPDSLMATSPVMGRVDQPGVGAFPAPGSVLRMSGTAVGDVAPAPELGADTRRVLRDWLGADDTEIDEWERAGLIGS